MTPPHYMDLCPTAVLTPCKVARVQKLDVERFLYENIAIYTPALVGQTVNFATYTPVSWPHVHCGTSMLT